MFKLHEIRELIRLVDESSIQEFKLDHEGSKLTLKKQPIGEIVTTVNPRELPGEQKIVPQLSEKNDQPINQTNQGTNASNEIDKNLHQIKSPMVGTFYKSPTPESEAYVKVGDKVTEKSVVCIIEAMKLFNEIEAEANGEIVDILVENGQLVEYGQPLFLVKK